MTATCPSCGCEQGAGLLCSAETDRLERDLGDVASIVADLDITLSKMARIGTGGAGGLARERTPIHVGAMTAGDNLANVLTTWARDVTGGAVNQQWLPGNVCRVAAAMLLSNIDAIRRHPAADELVDEISDAVAQARRVVDRPADRVYLGQCLFEEAEVVCLAELYASPGASEVRCRVCGVTHPVAERRAWLLKQAEDMLFTAAKASEIMGEIGHIAVSQARIRGYIHRGKIAYRAPVDAKLFRLGDLLDVVLSEGERKSA